MKNKTAIILGLVTTTFFACSSNEEQTTVTELEETNYRKY